MTRFGVWLTTACAVIALVVGGLVIAPVSATIQVLCKGVSTADTAKCNPGYAAQMSKMHWRMYGGHNCTNFVAYQLGVNGVPEPKILMGNARDWAANAKKIGYTVNTTPAVGSVGAWPGKKNHVTYVAEVGDGYIVTREDNYPGYYPKGQYQELKISKGDSSYPTSFIHFRDLVVGSTPTISGTTKVGSILTASTGTWTPSTLSYAYKWMRDGVVIPGATSSTYTLAADDADRAISVTVTGSKSGYVPLSRTSAKTAAVEPGELTNVARPAISGTTRVGSKLTATPGSWAPSPTAYAYQWRRGSAAIPAADSATYTPVAADVDSKLSVTVTATKSGYPSVPTTSAQTAAVVGADDHAVPSNLRSTSQTASELRLAWDAVANAPKYRVQISTSSTMSSPTYHAFDGTTGTITGLKPKTKYYLRIWVVDEPVKVRLSEISGTIAVTTATTGAHFDTPSGLRLDSSTTTSLALAWNADPGAPKYRVQLSTSPTMSSSKYYAFDGASGTITGLTAKTAYYARIWVVDSAVKTRLSDISPAIDVSTAAAMSTAAPAGLQVASVTPTSLTATWSEIAGAPKYRIQVSTSPTMSSSKYHAFTGTQGTISGLTPGTPYYLRIWTVNEAVTVRLGDISETVSTRTTTSGAAYAVPSGLRSTSQTTSAVALAWEPVLGAPKYRVQISTAAAMTASKYYAFDGTTGTIAGLKPRTTYYVRIWVVDSAVKTRLSDISANATATTK
ncbi:MAG: hypothetical protein JWR27_621 [Aeromicrobium sp.]|nr:hypothetical protein [Aeromicrobium sp.]